MSVTAVPIRPLARGAVLKLWIALLVLVLLAAGLAWFGTREFAQRERTASGLVFEVIEEGEGAEVTPADLVALHYELSVDGRVVEDSQRSGQPMITGTEGLFPGFSEGLKMMRQGGTYRIWVPPHLGMPGPIPPNVPFDADDTLVFRVQVLEVARGMAAMGPMLRGGGGSPPGAEGLPPGAEMPPGAEPLPVPPPLPGAEATEESGQGRGRGRSGER